jgi:hypothetical protein
MLESFSGQYALGDEATPEGWVLYDEGFVRSVFKRHGFRIREPISYGPWVEQALGLGARPQDVLVAYL